MKRKALGRGLRSLIPQAPPRTPEEAKQMQDPGPKSRGLLQLDLDRILPNREQPRRGFDQESLEELASSIKREGILQPVIVRSVGDGQYQLIAGERRWRAAQIAGVLKIPALVREAEDRQVLELALIENLQREDLNPIESASAFRALIEDLGLTQQEVAQRVGKQRATVSNMLRLLDLPPGVKDKIQSGAVTTGHAKALASMNNPEMQVRIAERIAREGMSVREVEALAKRMVDHPGPTAERKPVPVDPNITAAEEALQRELGTKVSIVQGKKGGRIELHFFGPEEMERVYQLILNAAKSPKNADVQT
jgi:ParB family chromosome partitioning protein